MSASAPEAISAAVSDTPAPSWSERLGLDAVAEAAERHDREDRAAIRELGDDDLICRASCLQREMASVDERLASGELDEVGALIIRRGFEREHEMIDAELTHRWLQRPAPIDKGAVEAPA